MTGNPDLADVISQATASGVKVILAGDTRQLQAVENGGGLCMLAGGLGCLAGEVLWKGRCRRASAVVLRTAVLDRQPASAAAT